MECCYPLFRCNTCYYIGMVSATSALRYVTLAPRYESRPSMYIRGLIPRNWPMQFRLTLSTHPSDVHLGISVQR